MAQFIKPKSLSVVVPVRNEEDNVADLIFEIRKSLKNKINYEIIYVDDGSTDQTYKNLINLQKTYKELRVIRHQRSCGQSTAVRTGVKHAKYNWIATLDGDGQNNPAGYSSITRMRLKKVLSWSVETVAIVDGTLGLKEFHL
jgi:dolichol-phosphate mannosyltransferase